MLCQDELFSANQATNWNLNALSVGLTIPVPA